MTCIFTLNTEIAIQSEKLNLFLDYSRYFKMDIEGGEYRMCGDDLAPSTVKLTFFEKGSLN